MPDTPQDHRAEENEELLAMFPLAKSWRSLYAFVLVELVVLIGLFALFSHAYAP
jgi:hypothetical protein